MNRGLLLLSFILSFSLSSFAQQDYHFSQFFAAPITYNPANSGAFEADFRAALNYRSQFGSISDPYKTFAFSADAPIKINNANYDKNFLGVGLFVVNDNAGITDFNTFHIAGNVAYAIDLGGTEENPHFISMGLQIGFMQRSINLDGASWATQWTGTGFNQGISSGEPLVGTVNESNVDLGGGVSWFNAVNSETRILVGAAVLHANAPDVGLLGDEESMRRKYIGHVSMAIAPEGSDINILPNLFMMFQGPNHIIDLGAEVEFGLWERTEKTNFKNNLSTNLGAYYRYKDAIYFIGRVNYYDFSLGISYDFTASQLAENNNGQGGVELVLGYRTRFTGAGTNRQKLIRSKGL